jgi:hypothetical protein
MTPKYYVDFGNHAITKSDRKGKDVYDLIDFVNKTEDTSRYAFFIGLINEDEDYLRFRFLYNKSTYYVFYNKRKKKTDIFKFKNIKQEYTTTAYANYYKGNIYLAVMSNSDIENNPYLVIIDEKNILK